MRNRGGLRKGAGRHTVDGNPPGSQQSKRIHVTVSNTQYAWLESQELSISECIRKMVTKEMLDICEKELFTAIEADLPLHIYKVEFSANNDNTRSTIGIACSNARIAEYVAESYLPSTGRQNSVIHSVVGDDSYAAFKHYRVKHRLIYSKRHFTVYVPE